MGTFIATVAPPSAVADRSRHWFVVRGNEVLVRADGERRELPGAEAMNALFNLDDAHYLGLLDEAACFTIEVKSDFQVPEGLYFSGVRDLFGIADEDVYSLAGRAIQIVDWDRTHRFCGRCGNPMIRLKHERAKKCTACGMMNFPRLAPAVITLVERDGKALLAQNAAFVGGFYSILAGFVEPGESLEDTVRREIREEVGVEVRDIRYFGSQPWPYPHSLMIGFNAQWESGEISPDPSEIADAGWFAPHEFPQIPGKISISRQLIDDFVERLAAIEGA
jgi:NAD+ diphosphatase